MLLKPEIVLGQESSRDYVITKEGVRIEGTIPRSFDFKMTNSITFVDDKGIESRFYPNDLLGFGLSNGRIFESRHLPEKEDGSLHFFQVLLRGKVSLYAFKDRFFIENEKEFLELLNTFSSKDIKGNVVMTKRAQYLGILNYMLYGPCGVQLQEKIARTNFFESGFIKLVMLYHQCEALPYELLVEEIPVVRKSWVTSVGVTSLNSIPAQTSTDIQHRFKADQLPFIALGLKLDQWRRSPRVALDMGIGFSWTNNAVNAQLETNNFIQTATEEFRLVMVSAPVFVDYLLFRSQKNEFYLGGGLNLRFNSYKSVFSIIDHKTKFEPVHVELFERQILNYAPVQVAPALKLGTHLWYKEKWGIITELQFDYSNNGYSLIHDLGPSKYQQIFSSLLIGIRL